MKLWKRASGLLKDRKSLLVAGLSRRSSIQNPDIKSDIIKATSHDEFSFGHDNPDRVYEWLRISDSNIHPVVRSLASRVTKTRNWVVALKGLMLMHGILCTKLSVIYRIGKLPFNLSNFKDKHSESGKRWDHNMFIRAYFDYLDQKSGLLFEIFNERKRDYSIMDDLHFLQKFQGLLDLLLQIKPPCETWSVFLIIEGMECLVFEVFDIYSKLCRMIVDALKKIDSVSKAEAALILKILHKAMDQGDELASYFEFCKQIGVSNASNYPVIPKVPEEDVKLLEHIVDGALQPPETDEPNDHLQENNALVLRESHECDQRDQSKNECRTIVTSNWEKFEEDSTMNRVQTGSFVSETNPFFSLLSHPLPKSNPKNQELPDLIRF